MLREDSRQGNLACTEAEGGVWVSAAANSFTHCKCITEWYHGGALSVTQRSPRTAVALQCVNFRAGHEAYV